MKILIVGSTGMLGYSLMNEARKRKLTIIGAARSRTDIVLNVLNKEELTKQVYMLRPDVIINTVAISNLVKCELDPGLAYRVNTRPVSILAEICNQLEAYFIHISTDHYYTGDGDKKHTITSPVCLLNEYARTKYSAESLALTAHTSLVIRTNIVGFRYVDGPPTFIEWVRQSLQSKSEVILFNDFYTSSIDVTQFAKALFNLIPMRPRGILNLAAREVTSKKKFIETIAREFGYTLENTKSGSVKQLKDAVRAESLGLDVAEAESLLGYKLPTMLEVVRNLKNEYKRTENPIS